MVSLSPEEFNCQDIENYKTHLRSFTQKYTLILSGDINVLTKEHETL